MNFEELQTESGADTAESHLKDLGIDTSDLGDVLEEQSEGNSEGGPRDTQSEMAENWLRTINEEEGAKTGEDDESEDADEDDQDQEVDDEEQPEGDSKEGSKEEKFTIERNGKKEEFSRVEYDELASKGLDYTKKTQALADERKAFDDEMEQGRAEFNEAIVQFEGQLKEKEIWDTVIDQIEAENPALFEEIKEAYTRYRGLYSNPIIERQTKMLADMQKQLQDTINKTSGETTRSEFKRDMDAFRAANDPMIEALGIKVDWDKVQKEWMDGTETIQKAFYAEYGAEITKRLASKAKVATVKGKKAARSKMPIGGKRTAKVNKVLESVRGMDLDEIGAHFLNG